MKLVDVKVSGKRSLCSHHCNDSFTTKKKMLGKASKIRVKLGLSAEVGGGGGSGGGPRAQPVIRLLKSIPLTTLKHEKNDARP